MKEGHRVIAVADLMPYFKKGDRGVVTEVENKQLVWVQFDTPRRDDGLWCAAYSGESIDVELDIPYTVSSEGGNTPLNVGETFKTPGCPLCSSSDTYYSEVEFDGQLITQDVFCQNCGTEWHRVYEFKHSVLDVIGKVNKE